MNGVQELGQGEQREAIGCLSGQLEEHGGFGQTGDMSVTPQGLNAIVTCHPSSA